MKKLLLFLTILFTLLSCKSKEEELLHACMNNNFAKAQKLLDEGTDPDKIIFHKGFESSALLVAVQNENIEILKLLLLKNADPNIQINANSHMNHFLTPLSAAILKGNLKIAELLLQNGANPNTFNYFDNGRTPLLYECVYLNQPEMFKLLIEYGANIKVVKEYNDGIKKDISTLEQVINEQGWNDN